MGTAPHPVVPLPNPQPFHHENSRQTLTEDTVHQIILLKTVKVTETREVLATVKTTVMQDPGPEKGH